MIMKGGKTKNPKSSKRPLVIVLVILVLLAVAGITIWFLFGRSSDGSILGGIGGGSNYVPEPIYSNLTGLEITDADSNTRPTFCVQIPNGSTDGARPQAGLGSAAVVFEAIAETGITRFAAVFQFQDGYYTLPDGTKQLAMHTPGIIGPIRSLRPYYLDWDTPFDCTVVHDGGSDEALAAVGNGRYRNLDENFSYMWKEAYVNGQYRYWNNVFTSPEKLLEFNHGHDYNTSSPKTFPRLQPSEVSSILSSHINHCTNDDPACEPPSTEHQATHIRATFTNLADYAVHFYYDATTNTYKRSYEYGGDHLVYDCPTGTTDFASCSLTQIAPNSVVLMHVQESTMADGYHESIKTVSEGGAEIFQNGEVISGTWQKVSQDRQIEFFDTAGNTVKFTPGQLWIVAVPQFGSATWE